MEQPSDNIMQALGRLEGKVDAMFQQQLRSQSDVDELDDRLRVLEHSRGLLFGGCTVLAALASYLVTYFKP